MLITRPQPTTTVTSDALFAFDAVHQAIRVHSGALLVVARRALPTEVGEARELRDWFEHAQLAIGHHLRVVDDVVVPALAASGGLDPALEWAMAGSRANVAEHLEQVAAAVSGLVSLAELAATEAGQWQVRAVIDAVEALLPALEDRVVVEETMLVPQLLERMPQATYDEIHGDLLVGADPSLVPFLFPWLATAVDEVTAARLVHQLPRMVRTVHRLVWVPSHLRSYPQFAQARRQVQRAMAAEVA